MQGASRESRPSKITSQSLTNYSDPLNREALFKRFREDRVPSGPRDILLFFLARPLTCPLHLGSHLLQTVITSSWTSKNATIHHPVAHGSQPSTTSLISDLINVVAYPLIYNLKIHAPRNHVVKRSVHDLQEISFAMQNAEQRRNVRLNALLIKYTLGLYDAHEYINVFKVWETSSQYLGSRMSDDVHRLEAEYFRANDRPVSRSGLLKIPRRSLERLNNC